MTENIESFHNKAEGKGAKSPLCLPKLLSDGCVLQQGKNTRIWGKTEAHKGVTVEFQQKTIFTRADETGDWQIMLSLLYPGGPFSLTVRSETGEVIRLQQVYVGEVFVCSGQSNMELPMERLKDQYPEELCRPGEPNIRLYKVREHFDFDGPLLDHRDASWSACSEETIKNFSAVSYFFGRNLLEARNVPVGLINLSLGGTPAEAWMGKEALLSYPKALETLKWFQDKEFVKGHMAENERLQREWHERIDQQDIGFEGQWEPWKEIILPGFLKDSGIEDFCGSIWLRRKFHVPDNMKGATARLWLGTMADSDRTYINGELVGETGYQYPPRKYVIPEGVLKSGENEIVIRLVCDHGEGRMTPEKPYKIFTKDHEIHLEGPWEYRIGFQCGPAPEMDFLNRKPTGLYNAMVAPCLSYTVKGVLWYQGESNDRSPDTYEDLLRRLILNWRENWKQDTLPFVVAQLPGFSIDLKKDSDSWPKIRYAQSQAAQLSLVAVTINLDLGEWNDLHPLNKKEVARRMSLAVRAMIYGESVEWNGPRLRSYEVIGGCIKLSFKTDGEKDLIIKGEAGEEAFLLAGADHIFHPTEVHLEGTTVSLWCSEVAEPKVICYCYSNAPRKGLLFTQEGLPAAPFRLELQNKVE
jgi:sialate O-acetylesterase